MIGLLVVTHETLGQAYTQLAKHIFGSMPCNIGILNVRSNEQPETIRHRAKELIASLDYPDGLLILTDLFGATPCNVARHLIHNDKMMILTGLNAPMLVKATQYAKDSHNLPALVAEVKAAAIEGILTISNKDMNATT